MNRFLNEYRSLRASLKSSIPDEAVIIHLRRCVEQSKVLQPDLREFDRLEEGPDNPQWNCEFFIKAIERHIGVERMKSATKLHENQLRKDSLLELAFMEFGRPLHSFNADVPFNGLDEKLTVPLRIVRSFFQSVKLPEIRL